MRALTLTQPWAGLVASGLKLVENRPRSMIKREDFGKPFAIHASREIHDDVYERIAEIAPELITIARNIDGGRDRFCAGDWFRLANITSAVIGIATIDHIVVDGRCGAAGIDADGHCARCGLMQVDDDAIEKCPEGFLDSNIDVTTLAPEQRRWFFGPIGYVLRDVRALATPVPCRGWQGLWTLDAETEAKVMVQL